MQAVLPHRVVCMQECSFTNVGAERPLGSLQRATFFSDDESLAIGDNAGEAADPAVPLPLSNAAGLQPPHLDLWDDFFQVTMTVWHSL